MLNNAYRKRLIALVHIGKTQLKMDEATYRLFLQNTVNKNSCNEMDQTDLHNVLQTMAKMGAKVQLPFWQNRPSPKADKKLYLAKITALLAKHHLPPQYADGIAKRAFNIDQVQWLTVWQLKKVIQMLSVYDRKNKL
ncbi:gp16 family protein [Gallibacterium genomosp. 1]|uniref:Mu-like prophage protein gp16 n=1 Tax=Gallibacterium genomosp. 1 TaxID=155515 RepID=A0A0A2XW11_9PAST|nr:regulatory protein GemA [Gallibacterium genomosp. 1]KGQ36478.1 hypothetical protein JP36_10130 [Gallibacterium genomosp. 1]